MGNFFISLKVPIFVSVIQTNTSSQVLLIYKEGLRDRPCEALATSE